MLTNHSPPGSTLTARHQQQHTWWQRTSQFCQWCCIKVTVQCNQQKMLYVVLTCFVNRLVPCGHDTTEMSLNSDFLYLFVPFASINWSMGLGWAEYTAQSSMAHIYGYIQYEPSHQERSKAYIYCVYLYLYIDIDIYSTLKIPTSLGHFPFSMIPVISFEPECYEDWFNVSVLATYEMSLWDSKGKLLTWQPFCCS